MRFSRFAAAVAALALIACNAARGPAWGTGGNTLIETAEYTGVIISEKGAAAFGFIFQANTEFWEPSVDDVSRAEECIKQLLVSVGQDPDAYQKEHAAFILENLQEYRRQYVGIVVDGEKRIWTNAFRPEDSFPNWRRLPVYVLDGGVDFWEVEYILSRHECVAFHVHGEA